jgi:hypothetical protein
VEGFPNGVPVDAAGLAGAMATGLVANAAKPSVNGVGGVEIESDRAGEGGAGAEPGTLGAVEPAGSFARELSPWSAASLSLFRPFAIRSRIIMTPGTSISSLVASRRRCFLSVSSARVRATDSGSAIHPSHRFRASDSPRCSPAISATWIERSKARM